MAAVKQADHGRFAAGDQAGSGAEGDRDARQPFSAAALERRADAGRPEGAAGAGSRGGGGEYEVYDFSAKAGGKLSKMADDLGKRLSIRTNREELIGKNILKDDGTVTPSLLAAKSNLEKERDKDKLAQRLHRRPSKTDLKLRNILRVNSSDSLVEQTGDTSLKSVGMDARKSKLKSILKKRPERAELESQNILKSPEGVDPALASMVGRLQRVQLENHLEHLIQERPTPQELHANPKLSIVFNELVQILPTFRHTEYNRKPDVDVTFRRLTPKLKTEIRDELNAYKKNEMPVHEQSLRNTNFH